MIELLTNFNVIRGLVIHVSVFLNSALLLVREHMKNQLKVVFYWDLPFLVGWVFSCSIGEKPPSVGLVDRLLQQAPNWLIQLNKHLCD